MEPPVTALSWKTPRLNKDQSIQRSEGDLHLAVDRVDFARDPYLAGIIKSGVILYTGLHHTLADARRTCEEKAKEFA